MQRQIDSNEVSKSKLIPIVCIYVKDGIEVVTVALQHTNKAQVLKGTVYIFNIYSFNVGTFSAWLSIGSYSEEQMHKPSFLL